MGIRFSCPAGHKLNVKEFLAGKRGVCPECGAKFIIPMPTEGAIAELPQPVGVGQSPSVEIATSLAPGYQVASAAAAPSVIIPITDVDLAPPEVQSQPIVPRSEIPLAVALPESIVSAPLPPSAAAAGTAPEAAYPAKRERSRRNQIIISLLLLALVVLLAGVLIWVLQREANQTPVEKKTARHAELNQRLAMTSGNLQFGKHSSVGALKQ